VPVWDQSIGSAKERVEVGLLKTMSDGSADVKKWHCQVSKLRADSMKAKTMTARKEKLALPRGQVGSDLAGEKSANGYSRGR